MSVREEEIIPEVIEIYYAKRNARPDTASSLSPATRS
jgi:hypothetical protein